MLNHISRWLDPILLIGLFISIAISVLMVFSGNDTVLGLIVGLLSTIVTLLIDIIARIQKTEASFRVGDQRIASAIEQEIERVIDSAQGVDIRLFERREDVYSYLEKRIKQAKISIDVTHTTPSVPKTYSYANSYYETFSDVVKSGKVRVRRVLVVYTQNDIDWINKMIEEYSGFSFFLGCYPKPPYFIPQINLVIIDGVEVLITGGERSPSYDVKNIAIKHPLFAKMAYKHFDALWRNSMKLNEKDDHKDIFDQLEASLK